MSKLFLIKHISKGIGYKTNQQIFRWMSSFTRNDINKIFLNSFKALYFKIKILLIYLETKVDKKTVTHDQITKIFFENYLPNDILTKVDRASMYNSLEVRAPFLEKNIIEFSSSIPKSNLKIKLYTKNILRKVCKNKLPKNIVKRKKHGFAIPLSKMLRTSLKERV